MTYIQAGAEKQKFDNFDFIQERVNAIKNIAKITNISAEAIAGALLEENFAYKHRMIIDKPMDYAVSKIATWSDHFNEWKIKEATGNYGLLKKTNPTFIDVGPTNIQIGTAIKIIQNTDISLLRSLNIEPYHKDNFEKRTTELVNDLIKDKDYISAKIYSLYMKEAEKYFIDNQAYFGKWKDLPQEYKDALLITYVNFGKNTIDKNKNSSVDYLPQPGQDTAAGIDHLFHASQIGMITKNSSYGQNIRFTNFADLGLQNNVTGNIIRYSLKKLRLTALTSVDYIKNSESDLELYSLNNPNGMTIMYIHKRAEMLSYLAKIKNNDVLGYYQDLLSGKSVGSVTNIANAPHLATNEKIIFGTNDNDVTTLVGNDKGDFLFGGKGNDTLNGKGGNDYLEGGLDYDTYHIDGKDTIFDADMKGKVLLKDVKQAGFIQVNATTWVSVDKSTTAKRVNNDLVIVKGNDEATIKDYFKLATKISDNTWSGLDIWLSNMPFQMLPNKKDKINKYTIFTENNVIIDGSSKADLISANNAGRMIVKTGDGNDVVVSGYKADMIEGGAGNDVLVGSEPVSARDGSLDHDELVGGDGRDLVFGGDGNDVIHAGNRSEHLSVQAINEFGDIVIGGAGNDVVYGGVRNDFVQGGEGKDTLWGGAGMDILLGDGYIRPFNKFTPVATSATPKFKPLPLDAVGSPTAVAEAAISAIANSSLAVEFKLDNKQTNPLQFAELKGVGLLDDKISNWTFSINTNTGDYSFSKTGNELRRNFHVVETDNKRDDGDTLYGGAGNDLVIGQRGNDMLYGDIGNDILWGDDNRDKTISGSDVLDGGAGLDNLYGGLGADTFVFKKADVKAGEADIIHDAEQIDKLIFDNKQLNLEKWNLLAGKSNLWENATKNLQLELNGKDLTLSQVLNNQKTAIAVVKNFDSGDLGLNLPTKAAVSSRSAEYSYANTETITPYYHESNQYI